MTKTQIREYNRVWRAKNPEKCALYTKRYVAKNRKEVSKRQLQWRLKNRHRLAAYSKKWRAKNPSKALAVSKRWRDKNPEKQREASFNWRIKNKAAINANERKRRAVDHIYRLERCLRARLSGAIRCVGSVKSKTTKALTGCDRSTLISHLESKFRDGMTWGNYGKVWEVDHRRPCASFDLGKFSDQKKCFHYTNLQPLLVWENRTKGSMVFK